MTWISFSHRSNGKKDGSTSSSRMRAAVASLRLAESLKSTSIKLSLRMLKVRCHRSEGAAFGARRRLDYHDLLYRGLHGYAGLQCLLGLQGGNTLLCPVLDLGSEGP